VAKATTKSPFEKELDGSGTNAIDPYFVDGQQINSDSSDDDEPINGKGGSLSKNIGGNSVTKLSPSDDESFVDVDVTKLENDIPNDEVEPYNCDGLLDATLFPSFGGKLKPKFVKFNGNVFPPYPKTHPEGVAHIIELPSEILSDEKKVNQFRTALQYSMTKRHGIKTRYNVEFFSINGEEVPMNYFYRQCNGNKALTIRKVNTNLCRCKSLRIPT
jgi:hypothetical protein